MFGAEDAAEGGGGTPLVAVVTGSAHVSYASGGIKTTTLVTGSATGGTAGYTYGWSYVSGATQPMATSGGAATAWQAYVPNPYTDYTAVWRLTVTDSRGVQATKDINVFFTGTA